MGKTRNRYYNPNPDKKSAGDCVVRAMCRAMGKDWDTIYLELCDAGFDLKAMPNDKETWKHYLDLNGFIHHSISNKKGSRRPTVQSFAESHPKGTFVLSVANHLVTCEDGFFYDTWDCGEKSLYGYWEKPAT